MKKTTFLFVTLFSASSVYADFLFSAKAGTGLWHANASGKAKYMTDDSFSFSQLGIEKDTSNYRYASFEHFIPIIPNLKIEQTSFSDRGSSTQTKTFGNTTFDGNVDAKLQINETDFTLFWKVPGVKLATFGLLSLDYGLTAKQFNGSSISLNNEKASFNEMIPLLYLGTQFKLPATPIDFEINTKINRYKSSSIQDTSLMFSYTLPRPSKILDLRVDVGYKMKSINISDSLVSDTKIDIETNGMFFGISAKF